jgi:proteasome accessory factor C
MPKQELDAEEQFNLALSIVGLVLRDGSHTVKELAEHFDFSENSIRRAVLTIGNSEDVGNFRTHFYLDDELLEKGEIDFTQAEAELSEPPVLTQRQVAALATGLDYLASLPHFEASSELAELRSAIGGATPTAISRVPKTRELSLLTSLQDALLGGFAVICEYRNQLGERSTRTIDPLRIDFVSDKHYLRGFCHKNQAIRSFRIDRMVSVAVTDLAISEMALSHPIPEEVFGEVTSEALVKVAAQPEASEIFWNFPSVGELSKQDGELVGEIMVGSLKALGRHIARYGGLVRVISPQSAVDSVREFAISALTQPQPPKDED